MKKIYSSTLILVLGFSAAFAQNAVFTPVLTKTNSSTVTSQEPGAQSSPAAVGDTINNLYFDFSDAQSNWTFSNNSAPSYDWEIVTSVPQNLVGLGYAGVFNSGSGGEFAIVNSDGEGQGTSQECIIQLTDPIDLSAETSVNLVWQQYYRVFTGDEHYVEYSIDGGTTWVSTQVNGPASADPSDNPEFGSVNLVSVAGESDVLIRFRYVGAWGLFWAIDDVALVEGASDDVSLDAAYHGDVFLDWEYAMTPVDQTVPVYLGAIVSNNGGNEATGVACEYAIVLSGDTVDSGSFPIGSGTIAPATSDTGWFDTGYTPADTGLYSISYEITIDAEDATPENNTSVRVFETSEFELSHEIESLWDGQEGTYIASATDQTLVPFSIGSRFYPSTNAELTAIKVSFGGTTNASSTSAMAITTEVYEIAADGNIQAPFEFSEVEGVEILEDGWHTFVLEDPIPMVQGTGYIVAVGTVGGDDQMTVDSWSKDEDIGSVLYGPFGTGGAVNWYVGVDASVAVRGVFNPNVSISENKDISGFSLYPNPTNGEFRITYTSKEDQELTFNVFDMNGAILFTEQIVSNIGHQNTLDFDATEFATGMYFLQIQGASSTLTKRFVVN